jgi:hypothetical protein
LSNPDRTAAGAYLRSVLGQVPRLLASLDREADSVSYGSFDREYWAWKFRDFPVTMTQAGMLPLALLWHHALDDNPYHRNDVLREWILAAHARLLSAQHRNGAFDSIAPFTQDHGVTLVSAYLLASTARLLEDALPRARLERTKLAVHAAIRFGLRSREDYAFISNHQAAIALAFLEAADFLEQPELRTEADRILNDILEHQSPDGWYEEYGGPDPGYESLGIAYMAACWQRTRDARLLDSLRRAVDFYSHFVHPDGSVGGTYGSRQTALWFPSGFERLAPHDPKAAAVAAFMRERMGAGNVLTPAAADTHNLTILLADYVHAALSATTLSSPERLPCETLEGVKYFAHSAWAVAGAQHYYAVLAAGSGGPLRIHDRTGGRAVYEDAGYLVATRGLRWSSQAVGRARADGHADGNEVACQTAGSEVRQEMPTPLKFILLRLANLTLFRHPGLGRWLRRRIVARLITSRRAGPYRLERRVAFGESRIEVRDRLSGPHGRVVEAVTLPRRFTGVHMGSARYYHPAELRALPTVPVTALGPLLERAGEAALTFAIRFDGGSAMLEVETTGTARVPGEAR